jgi:hypothetical protein
VAFPSTAKVDFSIKSIAGTKYSIIENGFVVSIPSNQMRIDIRGRIQCGFSLLAYIVKRTEKIESINLPASARGINTGSVTNRVLENMIGRFRILD